MKIIKIFSDFVTSKNAINIYERLGDLQNDIEYNKTYKFTTEENYTHAIILNTAMPILNIDKNNAIGLAYEPNPYLNITEEFINYAKKNISKYFLGNNENLPECFIEHYSYLWYNTPINYIPIKNNNISIMVSIKKEAPGHCYRHTLVKYILTNNLPIDIYGNGCHFYNKKFKNIKGEFKNNEPYENYFFHIAIENFITGHWFSEKIINPLLCNTTPIYLGCKNIDKYFDNVIKLTGNIKNDLTLLYNICKYSNKFKKNHNIEKIKSTISIKNAVNLF